ncbi:uncharacterized protein FA14DRAFT_190545 [Meira miltonrushii]|uniref:Uncharacterized protein n=1 Tax=Meira miltonrushii TaxID=1280837 RepID=A0A316V7B0_9BASI|nr:uncharacterized protein FA14DRAFT_190545 [Meira miltonrushii]PWN33390.1 hypothetical protein FA14DRAFT_190545 [Meira miltonrushii]
MPIFGDLLEIHLFPHTVPQILKEKQIRTYYHKEYNIQYVNLEPVCNIDQRYTGEVVCGIKLHNILAKEENISFEFCVITVRICDKVVSQLLISSEDLERGVEDFYTGSFKSRTIGCHPIFVTFDGYGSGLSCSPHQVTFRFNMSKQRFNEDYIPLHFVNRFKEMEEMPQQAGAKRPREETNGGEYHNGNAYDRSQRASSSRPPVYPIGRAAPKPYNDDYHQPKRARTEPCSSDNFNGHYNTSGYEWHERYDMYERGRSETFWQPNGVPSSSSRHTAATTAQERDDPPRHLRIKLLKNTDSQQSGPSSLASDEIDQLIRAKREHEEIDPSTYRIMFVKEEPFEHTLSYGEPEQTDDYTLPHRESAAPSTASAFSEDIASNVISSAVDTAVTSVQEDHMDSAAVESAIQSVQSNHGQMNVATTSASMLGTDEVNGTVGGSSPSIGMQSGIPRVKSEPTDIMERARREMLRRASQRAQAQSVPESQQSVEDPLRQAATYSTVLDSTSQPSTSAGPSVTSIPENMEGATLQPSPNEEPEDENQIASTSSVPQETIPLLQQPTLDDQVLPSLNLPAQHSLEAGPSTIGLNEPVQNVNPRLISPLPQRALRSCIPNETQRQRQKRRVTFNTEAEDDKGGISPTKVN